MKALTIRQPWASLIALGVKTIETRSWSTRYRGPLAIHAGVKRPPYPLPVDDGAVSVSSVHPIDDDRWSTGIYLHNGIGHAALPLGAVVATCTLADVVPMIGPEDDAPEGGFVHVDPDFIQVHVDLDDSTPRYSEDETRYGDFAPGRFAWLLDDVKSCDPIPCKGRLGLWEPNAALLDAIEADRG